MKPHEEYTEIFKAFLSIGWRDREVAEKKFDYWFDNFKMRSLDNRTPREAVNNGESTVVLSLLIAIAEGAYL